MPNLRTMPAIFIAPAFPLLVSACGGHDIRHPLVNDTCHLQAAIRHLSNLKHLRSLCLYHSPYTLSTHAAASKALFDMAVEVMRLLPQEKGHIKSITLRLADDGRDVDSKSLTPREIVVRI
jgi:hypothetical protein